MQISLLAFHPAVLVQMLSQLMSWQRCITFSSVQTALLISHYESELQVPPINSVSLSTKAVFGAGGEKWPVLFVSKFTLLCLIQPFVLCMAPELFGRCFIELTRTNTHLFVTCHSELTASFFVEFCRTKRLCILVGH